MHCSISNLPDVRTNPRSRDSLSCNSSNDAGRRHHGQGGQTIPPAKGCSRAFQQSVGFAGGEAFPAFQHLAQRPVRLWTKHGMHMVRHHHPCMKVKALTGVEFHCTRNQIGDFGSRQPAITATRVEIFIHTCRIPAKQFFLLVPRQRTFGGAGKKARVLSWLKPLAPAVSRRIGLAVAR
jgi:hypothetical protein